MTEAKRTAALERIAVLTARNHKLAQALSEDKEVLSAVFDTITENEKTIQDLIKITDKRYEFLFNFKGGGWNSEWAYTIEEAKSLAAEKYNKPEYTGTCVPDMNTFRVSTPADYKSLLSMFY